MEDKVLAELKKHFRPEFLNRVDDVIIFQSLDESELARIVDIQLGRLEQRLAQQNLTLDVDAAAKKLLASEGYDPQFGARPLKRAIQEHLLDPLATKLLAGEFKPGDKIKVGPAAHQPGGIARNKIAGRSVGKRPTCRAPCCHRDLAFHRTMRFKWSFSRRTPSGFQKMTRSLMKKPSARIPSVQRENTHPLNAIRVELPSPVNTAPATTPVAPTVDSRQKH
jgi:hypothetical protein